MVKKGGEIVSGGVPTTVGIPAEDIIRATGKRGTIYFVDTNGFHRGGFIAPGNKKVRQVAHCLFLQPQAELIKNGYFTGFNYNKDLNNICFESDQFHALSDGAKRALQ